MSSYLIASLFLLFCVPAFFVGDDLARRMAVLAGLALAIGAAGLIWAARVPSSFFTEHPTLVQTPLEPTVASLAGGVLVLFGVGLFLVLGCRLLARRLEARRR